MNIFEVLLCILSLVITVVLIFINQVQFGKAPKGKTKKKLEKSAHYIAGQFQNNHFTASFTDGAHFLGVMKQFIFNKSKRSRPKSILPNRKINILNLDPAFDFLIWFGHSSYFIQLGSKKILVDPVFSGHASPVRFTTKSFNGSDIYSVDDLPEIDYLFITHDHWDHLDYKTISQLKHKVKYVITALGVGEHLEYWGFEQHRIKEMDWNESIVIDNLYINSISARHFSGRGFKRNKTLWSSFIIKIEKKKIFIGGDSGYDEHFKETGQKFGPFDLVILENGQYNNSWKYIHMMPEEVVQAAIDLKANHLLPVHWGKFSLSLHAWDEPIKRLMDEANKRMVTVLYPMIGEIVPLNDKFDGQKWWENID